jgi:hypothetical protein
MVFRIKGHPGLLRLRNFFMRYYSITIIFFMWLSGGNVCAALEATGSDYPFIWWSLGKAERLTDGRMEQALTLLASSVTAIEQPEAWLQVRVPRSSKEAWFKGQWSPSEPCTLVVRSNEYATVDVFAKAEIGGRLCFAQTRLVLYGQGNVTETKWEAYSEGPDWPEFTVSSRGESSYWPQTGHEFSLNLSGGNVDGNLEIWSGQGKLMDEIQPSGDGYKYIPPHDPELNRVSSSAAKPLIFVQQLDEGGSASFTQVVHRSRYGLWDKSTGMTLFAATFLVSALTIWLLRRKARPCC